MKRVVLLLVAVLAFNLSNAQDVYKLALMKSISYTFTDSTMVVKTKKTCDTIAIRLVSDEYDFKVYYALGDLIGKKWKYTLLNSPQGSKKYWLTQTSVDTFTEQVNESMIRVIKQE